MIKEETKLSREWIAALRGAAREPILIRKIHGSRFQEPMVDYLIWWNRTSIAIEFKVLYDKQSQNSVTSKQEDFMRHMVMTGNFALVVVFTDLHDWKQNYIYQRGKKQYHVMPIKDGQTFISPLEVLVRSTLTAQLAVQ